MSILSIALPARISEFAKVYSYLGVDSKKLYSKSRDHVWEPKAAAFLRFSRFAANPGQVGPGAVGQIGSCLLPIATSGGSQLWIAMPLVDWARNCSHRGIISSGLIDVVTENSENRAHCSPWCKKEEAFGGVILKSERPSGALFRGL